MNEIEACYSSSLRRHYHIAYAPSSQFSLGETTAQIEISVPTADDMLNKGPVSPSIIGAMILIFMLPLFVIATSPVSGAHLNSAITITSSVD